MLGPHCLPQMLSHKVILSDVSCTRIPPTRPRVLHANLTATMVPPADLESRESIAAQVGSVRRRKNFSQLAE